MTKKHVSLKQDINDLVEILSQEENDEVYIYADSDKRKPQNSITYLHPESIPKMAEKKMLVIQSVENNIDEKAPNFIGLPFYKVKLMPSKLKKPNPKIADNKDKTILYKNNSIFFQNKTISIPDGDQNMVCNVLFKNKSSLAKKWSWDELLEEYGESNFSDNDWRKVYNAGREINDKVAKKTTIEDLLIVNTKTIFVNPKYLFKT